MSKSGTESSKTKEAKAKDFSAGVAALERGEVIAFPTETLYGLGADALDVVTVEKVFQLKGRIANSPIPVLVADREMLLTLVANVPPVAEKLIARFWPGPLTIVLPGHREIPRPLANANGGIGVRISSQPIATKLVEALGRPLTATSANPSGQPPARTVEQAKNYFAGRIDVFVDGGEVTSWTGSTVVEIVGEAIKIIRAGDISKPQLEAVLGERGVLP